MQLTKTQKETIRVAINYRVEKAIDDEAEKLAYGMNCSADDIKVAYERHKNQKTESGEWIRQNEDGNIYSCSICGDEYAFQDVTPIENEFYFCPHCGAKMTEEK